MALRGKGGFPKNYRSCFCTRNSMNLRDLFEIDLDAANDTSRELRLKLVAVILRAVAVLSILFAIVKAWVT